ncbi:diacylglycerol kinase catalytic domain protein [Ancylostoma duodenale]|uniref:Diacylglycerol kinase catalytic domain protein n=1 Tax=Ancylostoma duodenale TaxID=51022 RepID=A0A0C2GLE7_9BILA|nr:diacylglycerol kinase catalytic domain protein [Ancylostoma duodenale]
MFKHVTKTFDYVPIGRVALCTDKTSENKTRHPHRGGRAEQMKPGRQPWPSAVSPSPTSPRVSPEDATLYFNFVFKKDKYRWRLKQLPVTFKSKSERDYWKSIITATLSGTSLQHVFAAADHCLNRITDVAGVRNRPKNIIVFINPFGGKGKAQSIFQNNVETFFKLTPGLKFEVILTQRANHARDYILEMSAEQWQSIDGLVSVGGDGLFNELLSGALLRTQLEAGTNIDDPDSDQLQTPHIRFGIIGAGSANSIVSTVHETADYATAAVHIAIGGHHFFTFCPYSILLLGLSLYPTWSRAPPSPVTSITTPVVDAGRIGSECNVDVCTVHKNNHLLRISANAISYGWLGDVLRDSERYRWLGPIRYQWSALRTTIRHPIYKGIVSFTLSRKETEDPNKLLPPCLTPCEACDKKSSSDSQSPVSPVSSPRYDYHWHAEFTHVICCVIPTVTPFTPYGLAPFTGGIKK